MTTPTSNMPNKVSMYVTANWPGSEMCIKISLLEMTFSF